MCWSNYQEGSSGVAEARHQGGVSVLTHGLRADTKNSSNVGSIYHKPATDLHTLHVNSFNSHDKAMW